MMFKKIKARDAFFLLGILTLAIAYQNCSNVKLAPLANTKLSCDPSVYNITREAQTVNGQTVYFVQQNNHDISNEYSGTIQWTVNGIPQEENITHDNRLLLNCETHPQQVEITAKLITDCNTEIEIFHSDEAPNTCEEAPTPPQPPGEPGPEISYCDEYKQQYPGVEDVPGFDIRKYGYEAIDMEFNEAIQQDRSTWPWDPEDPVPSIEELSNSLVNRSSREIARASFLKAPNPYARGDNGVGGMRKKFIAIPIKVPASSVAKSLTFTFYGERYYTVEHKGYMRISISPCKGDFRFLDRNGIGQPLKNTPFYSGGRGPAKIYYGDSDINFGFGTTKVPKGKTVYLNIAFYTFDKNYDNPSMGVDPDFENGGAYTCPDIGEGYYNPPQYLVPRPCGCWMSHTEMSTFE